MPRLDLTRNYGRARNLFLFKRIECRLAGGVARPDVLHFICIVEGRRDFLDLCITCHDKMKLAGNGVDARVDASRRCNNPVDSRMRTTTITMPSGVLMARDSVRSRS
jgi:hypothetical protein